MGLSHGLCCNPSLSNKAPLYGVLAQGSQPGMGKQGCPLTSSLLQTEKQGVDGVPGWGLTGAGLGGKKVDQ